MNNREAYNIWAEQYDTNKNLTRDLEAKSLRDTLGKIQFSNVLEIGCGTGKNSEWLVQHAHHITAVDFSEEMLEKARAKVQASKIEFKQADITKEWNFTDKKFDLICFSLVLEHIKDLDFIFAQARQKIADYGHLYIGELHPFKQYTGTVARFDTDQGRVELDCYVHNISEFLHTSRKHKFSLANIGESFDEGGESGIPRILMLLFNG